MSDNKKQPDRFMRRSPRKKFPGQGFYTPFEHLDQHLDHILYPSRRSSVCQAQDSVRNDPDQDEKEFLKAMADVAPLALSDRERVPVAPPAKSPPRFLSREEMEVYAHLVDLVTGEGPFELSYSDEYVDGSVVGLSPLILKKLRNGDFSYQDYLDLHGLNREQAHRAVIRFVRRSFAMGHRCVLIVSGRGLNSKERKPVLKENLVTWLTRAPLKRWVLAFASARSYDGGVGAFYIILRRNEGNAPLVTPAV